MVIIVSCSRGRYHRSRSYSRSASPSPYKRKHNRRHSRSCSRSYSRSKSVLLCCQSYLFLICITGLQALLGLAHALRHDHLQEGIDVQADNFGAVMRDAHIPRYCDSYMYFTVIACNYSSLFYCKKDNDCIM